MKTKAYQQFPDWNQNQNQPALDFIFLNIFKLFLISFILFDY